VCFLAADWLLSPSANLIEISRASGNKLVYRDWNTISYRLKSSYGRTLSITIKDSPPDWHFEMNETEMRQIVPPNMDVSFNLSVLPSKRGSFLFEGLHGYMEGNFGLCRKYFHKSLPQEYKVYPDMRDLSKYRLIAQKKIKLFRGDKSVKIRGAGIEFESLREYVEGDDTRKLNWMATARQGKLIVNQYQAEKNQPVFMLVDAGRPMSYSAKGWKKLDRSISAALILADIVNQQGDSCGLMVFDSSVKSVIMPGKGEVHRNRIMEELYHLEDTKSASDYEGAVLELLSRQKRSGLAFIFTDFETEEEAKEISRALSILKKRHTPIIILMESESLKNMAEGKAKTEAEVFEKAAAADFLNEREKLIRSLNMKGVACIESVADNFALEAVNRYLQAKASL
jgi:uncharacterized protein (DUF58 family)